MITRITSKFGSVDAVHKIPHTGVDIGLPEGTTLHSIANGVVDKVFDGTGAISKGLSIRFPDGHRAIYGHMNEVKVHVGDYIRSGEIVGLSGSTGRSTGAHLHLGLRGADGSWMDPTPFADKVANINWIDGPLTQLKGWLGEKFTEITFSGFVDRIADIAPALPIIAVVSFSVYALINIFSKRGAKLGAILTFIYGLFIV